MEELNKLKENAINKKSDTPVNEVQSDTLVFPVHYFDGISEFKGSLHSLDNEIQTLIGDTRIVFAMKKGSSIGNTVVRNKQLSFPSDIYVNQRCNSAGCRQCPLTNNRNNFLINNKSLQIPKNLNCKSKNLIYMWVCKLCAEKEPLKSAMIGQMAIVGPLQRISGTSRHCQCMPKTCTQTNFL